MKGRCPSLFVRQQFHLNFFFNWTLTYLNRNNPWEVPYHISSNGFIFLHKLVKKSINTFEQMNLHIRVQGQCLTFGQKTFLCLVKFVVAIHGLGIVVK